jgi:FtsZ-binding cell division protein ZapB
MLTASALASQENLLDLMDQSKEGRDILNSIYLQLHTSGPNLERGKIMEVLTTAKQNADKSARRQKNKMKRHKKSCKTERALLRNHTNANERHEFTVNRHLNANKHALNKNQQFIDRSRKELDSYVSLSNLLKANRAKWNEFIRGRIGRMNTVVRLLRKARRHLLNQHKAAMGTEFIEVQAPFVQALSELRTEFTNMEDNFDGLRPIIANLMQSSTTPAVVGKNVLRSRLIKLLKTIIKTIRKRRDLLEQFNEGADSLFEALLKSFEENKTRVTKLLERLAHEKNLLEKRQGALKDGLTRAHRITVLSQQAQGIRSKQCRRVKVRNARLRVSLQKIRNIVAQIEEILQERFGKLKSFFIERRMKFDTKQ